MALAETYGELLLHSPHLLKDALWSTYYTNGELIPEFSILNSVEGTLV